MLGFWIYMLAMALLVPAVMVVLGVWMQKRPPKRINRIQGYRTRRSMKSQAAWDFAQRYAARLWLKCGLVLLPLSALAMLFCLGRDTDYVGIYGAVVAGVQVVLLVATIFPVESALKQRFDQNGRPIA